MSSKFMAISILIAFLICFSNPATSEIGMFRNNIKRTGESPYEGPSAPNLKWTYKTGAFITSTPAVDSEGNLYFGDHTIMSLNQRISSVDSEDNLNSGYHSGKFFALSSEGELIWSYNTNDIITSSPSLDGNGAIYFGGLDNTFYALNKDGTLKWTYKTSGPIYSSPVIANNSIYFGSDDHNLYALDMSGNLKWSFVTGSWVSSSPSVGDDGTIFFGSYDGKIYALNQDGSLKFSFNTGTYIYSSPAINKDGEVFIGGYDGKLYAIKDGELDWTFQTGSLIYSSPAISSTTGNIYFGSNDNFVYAMTSNGNIAWSYGVNYSPTAAHNFSSSPVIDKNENIFIGSQNGYLYALDSIGNLKWSYGAYRPSIVSSPILASDNLIYFISTFSGIYALVDASEGGFLNSIDFQDQEEDTISSLLPVYPNDFYEKMQAEGKTPANPNDIVDPAFSKYFKDRLDSYKGVPDPNPLAYTDRFKFQGTPLPQPTALDEAMKMICIDMLNFKQDLFYLSELPYTLNITVDVMENPFKVLDYTHEQVNLLYDPATTMYDVAKDGANLLDLEVEEINFTHPLSQNPLADAIADLYQTFGIPLISSEIEELKSTTNQLPLVLNKACAFLIYACKDAAIKRDEAFAPLTITEKNFLNTNVIDFGNYIKDLGMQILDLCEKKIERGKLSESSMVLASAIDNLGSVLTTEKLAKGLPTYYTEADSNGDVEGDVLFYYPTPLGSIIIGGPGKTVYNSTLDSDSDKTKVPLLIIDIGGDDEFYNRAGTTFDIKNSISLLLDISGNDKYYTDADFAQGAGKMGVGYLLDFSGNDTYTARSFAQGLGYLGVGILQDKSGDDIYDATYNVQASAGFGVGILSDEGGNDQYLGRSGCQAFAFCYGAVILKETEGNDFYFAGGGRSSPYDREPGYERYTSQAQGAAFGMRNNYVGEPHASGGVAFLSDYNGNDVYLGDFYSQGDAYWLDTAVLVDSHGDDIYYARQYTQGAGIHLAVGLLLDESGNDSYITRAVSQGCGHDIGAGLLVDNGGDDIYITQDLSQGGGNDWALSLLSDASGNDQYFAHPTHSNQGFGNYRDVMGSIGLLLDAGGLDYYTNLLYDDNKHWTKELHGIGIDNECGDTGVH
ncbi:PQQ-binding-like beta-propeller repeat protein [bacterium]|nr:PQQ-binding-like beta-propeller repeat protein [bacterium]